jgi:hypothetical protein
LSGSNIDTSDNNKDPVGHTGTEDAGNNGNDEEPSSPEHNHQSTPERWILVLAITILAFGIILLTLRSVVFSLILVTIGVSLFAYWLYVGVRSKEQSHSLTVHGSSRISSPTKLGEQEGEIVCSCPICKHTESRECLESRCPCCVLMRNKQIIGHFNPHH